MSSSSSSAAGQGESPAAAAPPEGGPLASPAQPAPDVARFLGFAGAAPFWLCAPAIATHLPLVDPGLLASLGTLQVGYGATILSFLGGVHWGVAMTNIGGEGAAAGAALFVA